MNFGKNLLSLVLLIIFTAGNAFASDFYWVGNSGNWNDAAHWASSSGGNGGIGIPTVNDDVYFDKKSFKRQGTVTILNAALCKNFSWTNSKEVALKSKNNVSITVKGSFKVNANFNNQFYGKTIFTSTQNETTLFFDRSEFLGDIEFKGSGSWILSSNLITTDSNSIILTEGEIIANNITIYAGKIDARGAHSKVITAKDAVIYAHQKVNLESPLRIKKKNTSFIINKKADQGNINTGRFNANYFTYAQDFAMKAICGNTPLTVTLTVLSDYNGFGESCAGACDGQVFVAYTGGVGPFETEWTTADPNNGLTTDTISNVCSGNVGVTITDLGQPIPPFGFLECTETIQVDAPVPLALSLLGTLEPTCNGDCDGALGASVQFGVPFSTAPIYTISWTNTTQISPIITNLCANSYTISVEDANGCAADSTFTLTEPNPITFILDSININCFDACDGSASLSNIAGGNPPNYSISWSTPPGGNASSISNLCPGNYVVTVTDDSLCFAQDSVNITEIPQIQFDTVTTAPSCGGDCDASITVSITGGGSPNFTHNWSNGSPAFVGNISTINNLCAGTYCDTIIDALGCDTIICFTITEPDTVLTSTLTTDLTCNGICDGKAITTPTGGTQPYTYVWDSIPNGGGFPTFDSIVDLCPGTYFVRVRDTRGCLVFDTVVVSEPPLLFANASSEDLTCPNFDNGTATVSPTGGTGDPLLNYTYVWTGPSCAPCNTQSINSLMIGTYYVTVTDSAGCIAEDSVIISEPPPLNLAMSFSNETCAGNCDGTAAVNATGGTGDPNVDFTYVWTPDPTVPNGQGTDSIFNLCPNLYTVTVTDSLNCVTSNSVTINPSPALVINLSITHLSCNAVCTGSATVTPAGVAPYTVSWDGAPPIVILAGQSNTITGLCGGGHTAVVIDNNGCIVIENFVINEPPAITTTTTPYDVSCFGLTNGSAATNASGGSGSLTYTWDMIPTGFTGGGQGTDSIFGLSAGTYYVIIEDDSSCTLNDTITILEPNEIFPNVSYTNISCNGLNDGTATSLPTGGVAPPQFSWTGPSCSPCITQTIGPLAPGNYTVTVTDGNLCSAQQTITIEDPPLLTVTATATGASCGSVCDGTALATPNGGTPGTTGYTYSWNTTPTAQTTQIATGLCVGQYTVTVTDSMGCTAQDLTDIVDLITLTITPNIIGISCNGVCDGEASVTPSGGTAPYTYLWNAPAPNTDSTITGLCPGFITVTVEDALGCIRIDSVNMPVAPPVLVPNGQIDRELSCFGECDAQVSHSPSGGTLPYTSIWSVADTNNVCPTSATITVTDGNGCVESEILNIIEPDSISANAVVVNVLCNGDATGSITLSPTGGAGGTYFYTWVSGPIIGSGSSTNNLPAGIYTIEVSDSNGCMIVVTDTINEPPVLSTIPVGVDVSCNSLCDGMMTVIVNGGLGPYTYSWQNSSPPTLNATGDTLFNVCSPHLTNTVTITDANLCITTQPITIIEPDPLDANVSGTTILCPSDCNGTVISNPTGGTPGYSFQWSTSVSPAPINLTDSALSNLCVGNYLMTVTDNSGCTDTASYTVDAPLALVVTLDSTNITCNGDNNGTATANVSGGTLPYSFAWVGGNAPSTDTNFIDNLIPGVYTVTVSDGNNCTFIASINIEEPQVIDDNETVILANCGIADGSIVMNPSGGTLPFSHAWNTGNIADTLPAISGLSAGFYTDTITDANGCIGIFTVGISNPAGPSGVTATINNATCFGSCDGSINVIVIGGAPNFQYTWTGPNGFTGTDSTETGLCEGIYNLNVTDNNLCELNTSLVVRENDSITANSTFTNASCNAICDGTASVSPTGGTAPYTFIWSSNGSSGSTISGLCTGTESVTITDFFGCQKVVNFIIDSPNSLTISSTITNPSCHTDCNGTATANPIGGTAPYSYQWNDPSSQTGPIATGLCDGTYIVTVTDFEGCSENDTLIIVEPTIITVTPITTPSTCGNSDGTAAVCGSIGGTGNHNYLWTDVPGNPTTCAVAGLGAGTYTVEISDSNFCTQSFLIPISDTNGPTVSTSETNASCDGVCDGQATATVSGIPVLNISWQPGLQTTPTITGLCAGNYTVEVSDGNGCITTEPVTIIDNTALNATVSAVTPTCNGDCDGSALVTPTGGLPPYSYSWVGGNAAGQTINAVGGLCAGNYTVTVTDFIGCSFPLNFTIDQPDILTASVAGVSANCNDACDGQATATPAGGTGPYTYLWSNNATTPTITALCEGNYTVTITDFKGCTAQGNVTIGDGVAITATAIPTMANCGQCDGEITVTGGGGSGAPYTYLWSVNGSSSPTISNLCPGNYLVEITDNLGCSEEFTFLIDNVNGPSLTTLADSTSCFGTCNGLAYTSVIAGTPSFDFQWDDPLLQQNDSATGLCAGLYNVIVQDGVGCITLDTVSVLQPEEIIPNFTFTTPSCPADCDGSATVNPTGGAGSYTFQWNGDVTPGQGNSIVGLCTGTHRIIITDATGCTLEDSITLIDPTPIAITASATQPTCFGDCDGTAIANASGGGFGYQYAWNTSPINNNSLIGGLCAGQYIVTVTDNNNCSAADTVQVIDPTVLGTSSIPTNPSCGNTCDGEITTTPTGGVQPYTYLWNNGETTPTITNLCAGVYDVIIVDRNNCTITDTITLTETILDAVIDTTSPVCGTPNGSIISTPVGAGPFNFVWSNAANVVLQTDLGVATSLIAGLNAGTYQLEITDPISGCISNYIIILNNPDGPALILSSTDESCLNQCDGTATAVPTGGTAPYTYSWVPAVVPNNTLPTSTNLCADFYTVTVTDSNNCISSDTISINTIGLNLSITSIVPETCFGDADGTATVAVTGGTPNYLFDWSPTGGNAATTTPSLIGNYMVTVTDDVLCTDSISTSITGPDLLTVVVSENTPISCNGLSDGAAIATVLGGNPNYQYSWNTSPIQTTPIATNLSAGTYIVTIEDDNGCTATDSITLTEPDAIVDGSSIILPACQLCDGQISVSPTGGSGNYSFTWTTPGSPPLSQPNTALINNLCAGAYSLIITDNISGCSANFSYPLSNTTAPDPNLTDSSVTCNGFCKGSIYSDPIGNGPFTYLWSSGSPSTDSTLTNLCAGDYSISVTDANGCIGVDTVTITQPDILEANLLATNINCNGICDGTVISNTTGGTPIYTYNWAAFPTINDSNLTGLCAGTYIVSIEDDNNCEVTDSISIIEPSVISSTSAATPATCSSNCDGEATLTPSGGIGPYAFEWNGNTTPGQGNSQTGLCFGLNVITIFDDNGCSLIDSVYIGATDTVIADAGVSDTICLGDPVNLNGVAGGTFTAVEWFELPSMTSMGTTDTVTVIPTTVPQTCYTFEVTGACIDLDTVCITVDPLPVFDAGEDVEIFEDGSTPLNATGGYSYSWSPTLSLSDTTIANPIASPQTTTTYIVTATSAGGCVTIDSVTVTVLPRIKYPDGISPNGDGANDVWIIDFIEQYPENVVEIYNRWGELLFHAEGYQQDWDGTYNGEDLPIGTYYYIIDLNDESIKPFTGPLTILR